MKKTVLPAVSWPVMIILFFLTLLRGLGVNLNQRGVSVKYKGDYFENSTLRCGDALRERGAAVDGSCAVICGKDCVLGADVQENRLFLTELSTGKTGENRLTGTSEFALPAFASLKDGITRVSWKYNGVEPFEAVENGTAVCGVVYTFADGCGRFSLRVVIKARREIAGPFEFVTELTNLTDRTARIYPASFASFTFKMDGGGELVTIRKESGMAEGYTHYDGQRFDGGGIYRQPLKPGKTYAAWVNPYQSFNENGYLPMVFLDRGDSGCYAALEWPSGELCARCGRGGTRISVDMDCVTDSGKVFTTRIPGGSAFVFPTVYLGAYDGTLDEGSNGFKQWFFRCKAPAVLRENLNEPLTQMDFQSGLETYGIEAVKWDYGWWSADALGNWETLEGSWQLRDGDYLDVLRELGCGSLAEFGALTQSQGKSLTAYVLLHDTLDRDGSPTDAYGEFNSKTHPEWFSDRRIDDGMGASADLGNEDCVAYLQTAMADFFNQNHVTTWRSDFEPICYTSDKENRHDAGGTDVHYWCSVGFRDLVAHLYGNVDGFRYESCSSGGSMKDLFTATMAVVINCDDAANYAGMRSTFYDSSYVIHPAQLQMPCNADFANPSQALFYPKTEQDDMSDEAFCDAMLDMGFRTQCLGVPMFSSWTGTLMTDYYTEYAQMYKTKIRPLVRAGELYHILPRPDGVHWDGVQYADKDAAGEIKGAAFLFKPSAQAGDTIHASFCGLDENTAYTLRFEDRPEQNVTLSGEALMREGIDVTIAEAVGSEIIWICA